MESTFSVITWDDKCFHEVGSTRTETDYEDLSWFNTNCPFDLKCTELQSLTTGLIFDANCDDFEFIGSQIRKKLNRSTISEATIKRSDHITNLKLPEKPLNIGSEKIVIDPAILFFRLTLIPEQQDNIQQCFQYELTPAPTSLFKDNFMRKPRKPALRKALHLQKLSIIQRDSDDLKKKKNVLSMAEIFDMQSFGSHLQYLVKYFNNMFVMQIDIMDLKLYLYLTIATTDLPRKITSILDV